MDPPPEYLERLRAEGKSADNYWKHKKQMPGRRTAAPGWADRVAGILTDRMRMKGCEVAPHFFYGLEKGVVVELGMDDLHLPGERQTLEAFRGELRELGSCSGGEIHELGVAYERRLKRLRARFEHGA